MSPLNRVPRITSLGEKTSLHAKTLIHLNRLPPRYHASTGHYANVTL
eukprot:CAMPEP_0115839930 /NCGR_PEP_ID=MMETSP0287-20121206/6510_1 /TAXON_ID=412157 /ORGANISM="Chrysochromulina rotalis, Strain UIO044" /LENGTH=46 /DNA_ID= /DNA_START= /DNA_END= /DNA_ORIENTATION=